MLTVQYERKGTSQITTISRWQGWIPRKVKSREISKKKSSGNRQGAIRLFETQCIKSNGFFLLVLICSHDQSQINENGDKSENRSESEKWCLR